MISTFNKLVLCLALCLVLLINNSGKSQSCIGAANLKSGPGYFQWVDYTSDHQIIAGGFYYTSTQGYFAYDGDTLRPNSGDVITGFAVVMDTSFNLIRMFNVIGFNDLGGGFNDTRLWDMKVDAKKNIYIVGSFVQDTLNAGSLQVYSDNYQEGFMVKTDSLGSPLLLKSFGSRAFSAAYTYEDAGTCIDVDTSGNIYLGGFFKGDYFKIDADTVHNGTSVGLLSYGQGFACAMDSIGQILWLKSFGTPFSDDAPYGLDADENGNVVLTGATEASNAFFYLDAKSYKYKTTTFSNQSFVVKYASGGIGDWIFPLEVYAGTGPDILGMDVATDDNGNIYAMGYFDAGAIFKSDTVLPTYGFTSSFLVGIDSLGQNKFVKTGRIDTFYAFPGKMSLRNDKVMIVGQSYTNQLWFENYGVCCRSDSYFAMYDTSGTLLWLKGGQSTSTSDINVQGVTISPLGTAYAVGSADGGQVTIIPTTVNANTSTGNFFIVRFGDLPSNNLAVSITNNGTDTVSCGGGTLLVASVTPNGPTTSYFWGADNDTMTFTFPGANLFATPKVETTYIVSAYRGACVATDTIVVHVRPIPFNVGNDTLICKNDTGQLQTTYVNGGVYSWFPSTGLSNDSIYNPTVTTADSISFVVKVDSLGCKASDTLDINVVTEVSAAYIFSGSNLNYNFTNLSSPYDSCVWDFNDGNFLSNVDSPNHTYSQSGIYKVCLSVFNQCEEDSVCQYLNVTNVGINEFSNSDEIIIYQANNHLFIKSKENNLMNEIYLRSVDGKVVKILERINSDQVEIETNQYISGIYLLEIITNGKKLQRKIMIIN